VPEGEGGTAVTASWTRYITEILAIERVTVVFPTSEINEVGEELYAQGYSIKRSGPYTDKDMFPKVDVTRQMWVCEKELSE
jgi:hypothetical protein